MKAKTFRILTFSVVGVLLAIVIALNVAGAMFGNAVIALLSGSNIDPATRAAGEALAEQIVQEGTVLVKNDGNVLPLDPNNDADMKVNVFGWSSVNWVSSGSGSGRSTNNGVESLEETKVKFLDALNLAGVEYNTELADFYGKNKRNEDAWDTLHSYDYESCRLYEPKISSDYTADLLANAEGYSDVAIVVLSRVSGESNDAPLVQYKGLNVTATPSVTDLTYLDASAEELELLEYVGEKFKKVIVLINATNAMNLNFMADVPGLDACLVAGGTGNVGTTGIVNILYGQVMGEEPKNGEPGDPVSPSGRLADTYPYDFRTNSSWANTGNLGVGKYDDSGNIYPIGEDNGNLVPNNVTPKPKFTQVSYLDYVEDIYVGYKWYETADADGFWDSSFAKTTFGIYNGYKDVVQYPFGYGLTYTDFEWTVDWSNSRSITSSNANDEITITVSVKNVGEFPAQEVVELYFTPPYNEGEIEKSAVNLLAFAKTPVAVEPGKTQLLDLTFSPADMGSYDAYGKKIDGGGWILEAGDYTLSLRTDAHTVKDMKNATFTMHADSDIKKYDEEDAFNIFTNPETADNGVSIDGSTTGENITYLTRSDFEGTFPTVDPNTDRTKSTKHRKMNQTLINTNLYRQADATKWAQERADVEKPNLGIDNGIKIFDETGKVPNDIGKLLGADYENESWDEVLDQISYNELRDLALHGYTKEWAVKSVGKERTMSYDGPSQIKSFNAGTGEKIGTGFPNPSVLAQTWNPELAKSFGLSVAKEAGVAEVEGWYAPGVNLHRSAFGGRNYEYYSEDSVLSGIMAAKTVEGSLDAGVYVYVKHIIGYDQETARDSLYCWMTEQALRETYLKPFKIILDNASHIKMTINNKEEIVEGTAGLMTSYGRIGSCWAGGSEALLTKLLREEWGYKGAILTDYSDHQNFMNGDQMVRAGGDIWMDGYTDNGSFGKNGVTDSNENNAAFVAQLREGAHHILYNICNAAYVNSRYNLASDAPIVKTGGSDFPLWTYIGIIDAVVIAGCAVWVFFAIRKKDKVAPDAVDAPEDIDPPESPVE